LEVAVGCTDGWVPTKSEQEQEQRTREAYAIRRDILATGEVKASMMTIEQLEVWLHVYRHDGGIRNRPGVEELETLRTIRKRFVVS
jgi:hypothetical protein